MTIIREARYEDMRQIISGVENVWVLALGMILLIIFIITYCQHLILKGIT